MGDKLRFHIDENVNPVIARALEQLGIDITNSQVRGLRSLSDSTQWEYCKKEGRVIVTHDSDFLRLAKKDFDHPGIVYVEMDKHTIGEIILKISEIYNDFSPEEMRGNIEYL